MDVREGMDPTGKQPRHKPCELPLSCLGWDVRVSLPQELFQSRGELGSIANILALKEVSLPGGEKHSLTSKEWGMCPPPAQLSGSIFGKGHGQDGELHENPVRATTTGQPSWPGKESQSQISLTVTAHPGK